MLRWLGRLSRRRRGEAEALALEQLLSKWNIAYELADGNRADRLLEVHARLEMPPSPLSLQSAAIIVRVEWRVVALYQALTDDVLEAADRRLSQVLASGALRGREPWDYLALAVLRLRQRRYDQVERLYGIVQASARATTHMRRYAFALLILARQEQGRPYEDVITAAAQRNLDLSDDLAEMRRMLARDQVSADFADYDPYGPNPADPARTDRLLAAYRAGDRVALHQVGSLGQMLVEEGRTMELRDLHATFPTPPGPDAALHVTALGNLSYTVLLDPDVPADVIAEAESRLKWILDTTTFAGPAGRMRRAAVRHTMAVVRLRQGKFTEVEALCRDCLEFQEDWPQAGRASALATVVLARRALGESFDSLLAEAERLAPHVALVTEARQG